MSITTPKNDQRVSARLAHVGKRQMQEVLDFLKAECPRNHRRHSSTNAIFSHELTRQQYRTTFGRPAMSEDCFALLMAHAQRDLKGALGADGFISYDAITSNQYGAVAQLIITMYVMNYGVAYATTALNIMSQGALQEENADRAEGIAVLMLNPLPTQKGPKESVVQLAIRRGYDIKQLTKAIQWFVRDQIKNFADQLARDTTRSGLQKMHAAEDWSTACTDTGANLPIRNAYCPQSPSADISVTEQLWREHLMGIIADAVGDMPQPQQDLLGIYWGDAAKAQLRADRENARGPAPGFMGQLQKIRNLTGLSVRETRRMGDQIVADFRQHFGISEVVPTTVVGCGLKRPGLAPNKRRNWTTVTHRDDRLVHDLYMKPAAWTHDRFGRGFKIGDVLGKGGPETLLTICHEGGFDTNDIFGLLN